MGGKEKGMENKKWEKIGEGVDLLVGLKGLLKKLL